MNWRIVRAIALKDLKEVLGNRMAWTPALIVPVIFSVVLPLAIGLLPGSVNIPGGTDPDTITQFRAMMPPDLVQSLGNISNDRLLAIFTLGYLFAPMFLIMPLMFASIVGSESFVGEKERKTIEALLYTPANDRELFLAKVLAAVIPSVLLSLITFAVYTVVVNLVTNSTVGMAWFPLPHWWPLMLWVAPAAAVLGIAATVIISSRVSTFMEAYQMSGALVLPVLILVIGQVGGVIFLTVELLLLIGALVWVIDAVLISIGMKQFSRSALMARV